MNTVDIVPALVAALLVALVGWIAYQKMRRDEAEFKRRFTFGEDGIERVNQPQHESIQFQGEGAQTTHPFRLEAGNYKIRYRFPDGVLVKVELLSSDDGDGDMILLKSGAGEAEFSLGAAGRYLLDIEPQDEAAAWKLEISRLGLPSAATPPPL